MLPALLDRARRVSPADPELRRLAAEAGGSRARWLAGLNSDWKFVTAFTLTGDDAWRLGDAGQRRGYLTALRARDPDAARELIAASWDAAGPASGSCSCTSWQTGRAWPTSRCSRPRLTTVAPEVRRMAAHLLARLPGSALGQRMAGRGLGCLRLARGISGTRLVASPLAECDAAMRRDGITPGPGAGRSQLADQAHLLLEVIARTPLDTWTGAFGRSAEQILAVPAGGWAPVLFTGWSRAAMAQRDQEWMAALISWAIAGGLPGHPSGAETLYKLVRRVDPALGAPGTTASHLAVLPPAVRDAITVLRFRYDMLKELDDDHSAG